MQLSDSVIESKRIRLSHRTDRTGRTTSLGILGTFFFGTALALIGLQIIHYTASSIHAPYWVITVLGGVFFLSGATLWGHALLEYLHKKHREDEATKHPHIAAYSDYPWNPKAIMKSPWSQVGHSFFPVTLYALFLTPFNWWAWGDGGGPLLIIFIVLLFDLGLLLGVVELFRRLLAALKYGKNGIEYGSFPLFTGQCAVLRWLPPHGLEKAEKITFTLRCVEEWFEVTGPAGDESEELVHDQLWAASSKTVGQTVCNANSRVRLTFEIPESVPGSYLSAGERIIFWEFEVSAEVHGVDFDERYLVPIYTPAS